MKLALSLIFPSLANYAERLINQPAFIQTFIEALEQAADPVCITNNLGHIQYVNRAFESVTGYSQAEALEETLRLIKSGKHNEAFYRHMWETIREGRSFRETMVNRNKAGHLFYVDETITPLKNSQGEVAYFLTIWKDVTKQHHESRHIFYKAYHDPLTKLPNRHLLYDRLETAMKKAQRKKKQLAVLFIDLDWFKPINDSYGHDAGDVVLQMVAQRIKSLIRDSDTSARLGGDEFIVVLEEVRGEENASKVARLMIKQLSKSYRVGKQTFKVGASIGIALFPDHGTDSHALIRNADRALYSVKRAGGGKVVIYSSIFNQTIGGGDYDQAN